MELSSGCPMQDRPESPQPHCIASTRETYCNSVAACQPDKPFENIYGRRRPDRESNCFRSAQLSADGSTVVTYSEDLTYRAFILPADLLDASAQPHLLEPYSTTSHASSAFALYPYFNLANPATTLAIHSANDLPIRLSNVLDFDSKIYTYPWENTNTEVFIAPQSLAFTGDGNGFVAGADHRLAVFDISRNGERPVRDTNTKLSRLARKRYGVTSASLCGIISALAIDESSGVLAAGTLLREVRLYDGEGSGEEITAFTLSNEGDLEEKEWGIDGNGVSFIKWSGDGRYLFVAERQSDGLLVYDIRVTGKRLAWLKGRNAQTTHKCSFDMVDTPGEGVDIWAGGVDGIVRTWRGVTGKEGVVDFEDEFKASSDTISSVMLHHTAPVFATTSGNRLPLPSDAVDTDSESESESESDEGSSSDTSSTTMSRGSRSVGSCAAASDYHKLDNTLKVWAMTDVHPSVHSQPP